MAGAVMCRIAGKLPHATGLDGRLAVARCGQPGTTASFLAEKRQTRPKADAGLIDVKILCRVHVCMRMNGIRVAPNRLARS
jgi:hypothetical protein